MFTVIRRLKVQPGAVYEVLNLDESELLPILRSAPGFVKFDLVQVGEDTGVSITIFETQEQADEANRRAAARFKQHITTLAASPAEILTIGEMRLRKGKEAE